MVKHKYTFFNNLTCLIDVLYSIGSLYKFRKKISKRTKMYAYILSKLDNSGDIADFY